MTESVSLTELNTLNLPARAREVRRLQSENDVAAWLESCEQKQWPRLILGGGSNVVFTRDFPGSVGVVELPGVELCDSDGEHHRVRAGAGVNWHELVCWTLDQGLPGLENLSLIPGRAGAAPMQNIGAYGVELEQRFDCLTAIDLSTGKQRAFSGGECDFAYRDSRFKREPDRWLITSITLRLPRRWEPMLDYAGLREELVYTHADAGNSRDISQAVCRIRRRKLPDPEQLGNVGSFFKNPTVGVTAFESLTEHHPGMPHWPHKSEVKLSAAWLIEQCGWKGKSHNGAGVHEGHALVLVNHGGATGEAIWALAEAIQDSVLQRFGISLEVEPRIISDRLRQP